MNNDTYNLILIRTIEYFACGYGLHACTCLAFIVCCIYGLLHLDDILL